MKYMLSVVRYNNCSLEASLLNLSATGTNCHIVLTNYQRHMRDLFMKHLTEYVSQTPNFSKKQVYTCTHAFKYSL